MIDFEMNYDCNLIAGIMKLWFRELPDSLLTSERYDQFVTVASELELNPSFTI